MPAFELPQIIRQGSRSGKPYFEFLRVPDLSMGVYQLLVGDTDIQAPHTEDEVYYVVEGKAKIKVADEDRAVRAGSVIHVAKNVPHRFHSIEEDLIVLVFFAPAEHSLKGREK
ncbi:MAG TPA: cupin domain-containing protein [Anaerolineales bacterium]|nr:cupin domain-containing protein [Anaerolineales bacterium]